MIALSPMIYKVGDYGGFSRICLSKPYIFFFKSSSIEKTPYLKSFEHRVVFFKLSVDF